MKIKENDTKPIFIIGIREDEIEVDDWETDDISVAACNYAGTLITFGVYTNESQPVCLECGAAYYHRKLSGHWVHPHKIV